MKAKFHSGTAELEGDISLIDKGSYIVSGHNLPTYKIDEIYFDDRIEITWCEGIKFEGVIRNELGEFQVSGAAIYMTLTDKFGQSFHADTSDDNLKELCKI